MAGGRHGRPVGLVGVLRGRLTACMVFPCYAVGRQQKHASDVCGETEAKAGRRQGRPVGLVGVLHGRLMACMARPCYAVGSLQKHADNVERGMTSPPLDNTDGQQRRAWRDDITALGLHTRSATSCVACHHRPWIAHTIERHLAWHDITSLGQHTQSNDVRRGMPSSPLGSIHDQKMSGVE